MKMSKYLNCHKKKLIRAKSSQYFIMSKKTIKNGICPKDEAQYIWWFHAKFNPQRIDVS